MADEVKIQQNNAAVTNNRSVPLFNADDHSHRLTEEKLAEYLADPDPNVFDLEAVKQAALKPSVKLQPHQQSVINRFKDSNEGKMLLMHSLGSGKTLTGLGIAEQGKEPYTAIVPASLRNNMRGEINKFTDKKTPSDVMSYTGVAMGKPVNNLNTLIFDEAQRLRNPDTKAAIKAKLLAHHAKRVALLSGTPIVNDPSDLAVPLSILTDQDISPEEFRNEFIQEKEVKPTLFQRLRGITPGTEEVINNEDELRNMLQGHVDYYAPAKPTVPVTYKDFPVEMSPVQTQLYKAMYNQLPFVLRWKLRWNFPLNAQELNNLTHFISGPREVGLSTLPFQRNKDPLAAFNQSTKLQAAMTNLQEKLKDPRTKALVFSNFIDAGLSPYLAALQRAKIPAAVFHGGLNDRERQKLVDDYNNGRLRVALLGPSGAEGLSFKGTQLIQLLDPYWNSARPRQSEGRGLRYDSHWGLPEDLQNVEIQRYVAKLPLGLRQRLMHSIFHKDYSNDQRAADDYLLTMAERKDRVNQQFVDLLKEVGSHHSDKAAAAPKSWTKHVMETSFATEPPHLIFTKKPEEIAAAAETKGVAPKGLRSWQRMTIFHMNRAGKKLSDERREALRQAIAIMSQQIKERKAHSDLYDPETLFKKESAKEEAKGIPSRTDVGDLSKVHAGDIHDWVVQEHLAERAGKHYDIRFGSPDTGLYSWVTKKSLPKPGEKRLAIRQPLHSHSYADFTGRIRSGYGAGTVKRHDKGQVLITKAEPGKLNFSTGHRRFPDRYSMIQRDPRHWLMLNTTPTDHIPYDKLHFKNIAPEKVDKVIDELKPGSSVQAKIDGAATLIKLIRKHFEIASYRRAKETGYPIIHTEREFHGRPEIDVPKDLHGTVLRSELFGVDARGRAIPPYRLGGILNSGLAKAIDQQKQQGITLKNLIFDIHHYGHKHITEKTPYDERLKMIKDVMKRVNFPKGHFMLPEEARTKAKAHEMWEKIKSGKNPLTVEGIVVHPSTGVPLKVKLRQDYDVHVRHIFPGEGKYKGTHAGGFWYSLKPGGHLVGKVGTGLSDEVRKDMWENKHNWLGRIARVYAQEQLPSGALRAPSFIALHEDYPMKKGASVLDGLLEKDAKIEPSITGSPLQQLLEAKRVADLHDYKTKAMIIQGLLSRYPNDFVIDSSDARIAGITHLPTGFRFHLPHSKIPVKLKKIEEMQPNSTVAA